MSALWIGSPLQWLAWGRHTSLRAMPTKPVMSATTADTTAPQMHQRPVRRTAAGSPLLSLDPIRVLLGLSNTHYQRHRADNTSGILRPRRGSAQGMIGPAVCQFWI